jgi:D-inositol-3-phosphate glycosyltransferase
MEAGPTVIDSAAYLSLHTSPLLQPGQGNAGGMNVYIDELAATMAARGISVVVYTRRHDPDLPTEFEAPRGYRVVHIEAGPPHEIPVAKLGRYVRKFAMGVIAHITAGAIPPQVVHSHYWLSGWAGLAVKRQLGIPLANSFHTLGRVKNLAKRTGEPPESLLRIAAEHEVIHGSDCLIASTPLEAEDLLAHYGADPSQICTSPPGVDHTVFAPGDRDLARARLGWTGGPRLLYVGRIQPLKGVDVAVEAFRIVHGKVPSARFVVVGGASGEGGLAEVSKLRALAADLPVEFLAPVPHVQLADYYRAADCLILPSRTESFGLVAAEAAACGLPVVAARVGGLEYIVIDGQTGFLVDGWDPIGYAEPLVRLLEDPTLASEIGEKAVGESERFSWAATADRFLELYHGILG